MKMKAIDTEKLLAWAQEHIGPQSVFSYPNPQLVLEAGAKEFWDFVMAETGMTIAELNETLDRIDPPKVQ
jgi:hypothetical protein